MALMMDKESSFVPKPMEYFDNNLYLYAFQFVGIPYRWGGDDPIAGYDCSGFVLELMRAAGIITDETTDMTAQSLYQYFSQSRNGVLSLTPAFGRLVFFGKSNTTITHVGFCMDGYRMLEAGGGDSSCIDKTTAAAKNAFIKLRAVKHRKDLIGIVQPNYPISQSSLK